MQQQEIIKTSVDSLIELVKSKQEISIEEASNILHIPSAVINDWAEFLEQENVLSIVYKKTTPFLTIKIQKKTIAIGEESDSSKKEAEEFLARLRMYKDKILQAEKEKMFNKKITDRIKLQYIVLEKGLIDLINTTQPKDKIDIMLRTIKKRFYIFEDNINKL